jgi:RND superfamily putative drug exporter
MGVVYLLSTFTTMSVFVTSTVSMFGIALAVDYSLFILMRFREELRAGRDPREAADAAMATSGLAVVLSGLTVIASLTGIYLINTPVLRSMATGAILAVAFAVLTSITLIPAVLATFGRAAARRSSLLQWSRRPEATQSRFWTRWVGWVMRRPWASALAATMFLLLLAAPAFSMVLGNSMQRRFPATHEVRAGVSSAAQALGPGALGPVQVLVTLPRRQRRVGAGEGTPAGRGTPGDDEGPRRHLGVATGVRERLPHRAALGGAVGGPEDLAARNSIDWLRAHLPRSPQASAGARIDVGGPTALIRTSTTGCRRPGPVFGFVALIAFVMLLISIRSVFLAFKGVVMTVLRSPPPTAAW